MTLQEMFDKAYIGLASQHFEQCYNELVDSCLYSDGEGKHCAWGWIDPSLGKEILNLTVRELNQMNMGIAATLDKEQLDFASKLQLAHDNSSGPTGMESLLYNLANQYNLTIPKID